MIAVARGIDGASGGILTRFFERFFQKTPMFLFFSFSKKKKDEKRPPPHTMGGCRKINLEKMLYFLYHHGFSGQKLILKVVWKIWKRLAKIWRPPYLRAKMGFEICLKTLKTTEKNVTTPYFQGKNGLWDLFQSSFNERTKMWPPPIFKAKTDSVICFKAPKMSVQKCDHPLFSGQK